MDQPTTYVSRDIYEALMIQMDLQQLKTFVLDPKTPPISVVIYKSQNFWRLRVLADYQLESSATDIANWKALYELIFMYGSIAKLLDTISGTTTTPLELMAGSDMGLLISLSGIKMVGRSDLGRFIFRNSRHRFTNEGVEWINSENFNTDTVTFWDDLATFTGVKSKKETLLANGYFLGGTTINHLISILGRKNGLYKYTSAMIDHLFNKPATYDFIINDNGDVERVPNLTNDSVKEVTKRKITQRGATHK